MKELALSRPDRGALFVVSGPSGVGKSTLLREAMRRVPGLSFSVSATTRDARAGEVHGVDYLFMDEGQFSTLVAEDAFIEYAEVYDRRYGTLKGPTERALAAGDSLILDVDVKGARNVRRRLPEAVHMMVLPPDVSSLEMRLRGRGTDSEKVIARRMELLADQLGAVGDFDYLVMNDDLETAHVAFQSVIVAELCRRTRRDGWVSRFVSLTPH